MYEGIEGEGGREERGGNVDGDGGRERKRGDREITSFRLFSNSDFANLHILCWTDDGHESVDAQREGRDAPKRRVGVDMRQRERES